MNECPAERDTEQRRELLAVMQQWALMGDASKDLIAWAQLQGFSVSPDAIRGCITTMQLLGDTLRESLHEYRGQQAAEVVLLSAVGRATQQLAVPVDTEPSVNTEKKANRPRSRNKLDDIADEAIATLGQPHPAKTSSAIRFQLWPEGEQPHPPEARSDTHPTTNVSSGSVIPPPGSSEAAAPPPSAQVKNNSSSGKSRLPPPPTPIVPTDWHGGPTPYERAPLFPTDCYSGQSAAPHYGEFKNPPAYQNQGTFFPPARGRRGWCKRRFGFGGRFQYSSGAGGCRDAYFNSVVSPGEDWYERPPWPTASRGQGQPFTPCAYDQPRCAPQGSGQGSAQTRKRDNDLSESADAQSSAKRTDRRSTPPQDMAAFGARLDKLETLLTKFLEGPNSRQ